MYKHCDINCVYKRHYVEYYHALLIVQFVWTNKVEYFIASFSKLIWLPLIETQLKY